MGGGGGIQVFPSHLNCVIPALRSPPVRKHPKHLTQEDACTMSTGSFRCRGMAALLHNDQASPHSSSPSSKAEPKYPQLHPHRLISSASIHNHIFQSTSNARGHRWGWECRLAKSRGLRTGTANSHPIRFTAANHPSASWRSLPDEAKRTTSSPKSRDMILSSFLYQPSTCSYSRF